LVRFNRDNPPTLGGQFTSAIARSMCEVLESVPEVVQNPALRGQEAAQGLLREMEPVILRWAIRHCEDFVRAGGVSVGGPALSVVEERLVHYRESLARHRPSLEEIGCSDVAIPDERSTRHEAPAQEPEAMDADEARLPPLTVSVNSDRIQPRLVSSSQKERTGSKRRRDSTGSSRRGSGSTQPQSHPAIPPSRPEPYRQLNDMLELPPQPRKLNRTHGGRGWRTRPAVHADPDPTL
jgi:hypothetical protein